MSNIWKDVVSALQKLKQSCAWNRDVTISADDAELLKRNIIEFLGKLDNATTGDGTKTLVTLNVDAAKSGQAAAVKMLDTLGSTSENQKEAFKSIRNQAEVFFDVFGDPTGTAKFLRAAVHAVAGVIGVASALTVAVIAALGASSEKLYGRILGDLLGDLAVLLFVGTVAALVLQGLRWGGGQRAGRGWGWGGVAVLAVMVVLGGFPLNTAACGGAALAGKSSFFKITCRSEHERWRAPAAPSGASAMTADTFSTSGMAAEGGIAAWHKPLADRLGLDEATVRAYAAGDLAIPAGVAVALRRLEAEAKKAEPPPATK